MPSSSKPRTTASTQSVTSRRPDRRVWQRALELADGDVRRLAFAEDGTVLVTNTPGR